MVKTIVTTTLMNKIAKQPSLQLLAHQRNSLANFPGNVFLFLGFVIMILTAVMDPTKKAAKTKSVNLGCSHVVMEDAYIILGSVVFTFLICGIYIFSW